MPRKEGQLLAEDYFQNNGGLNTAWSPFVIPATQAAGGQNYDYTSEGALRKRLGHAKINTSPDTEVRSLGISQWNSSSDSRFVVRVAGQKVQKFDPDALTFTNLSIDASGASTDIFPASQTKPVLFSQFNTATASVLWMDGAGSPNIYGVYSTTKVTTNGVPAPTASSFTATVAAGGTLPVGTYHYTLIFHKLSTGALSNGGVDASATSASSNNTINLAWTLTNNDTTQYDLIYIYRSAVGGVSGFTTGDLIAQVASSATTYSDTGTSISSSVNVPRAGATTDNSQLPTGTPIGLVTYKRRLVTALNSTIYISDVNKPESWPTANSITIPSGGGITGFGVISFTSRGSNLIDEILVVFKQTECWLVTGSDFTDITLKFIDNSGCPYQSLVAYANGYLYWAGYRGFMTWNGTGKPGYASRFIEDKFKPSGTASGDIDKAKLGIGFAIYSARRNEVEWYLSTASAGENRSTFKLDLRLTLGSLDESVGLALVNGVFTPDVLSSSVYAGGTFYRSVTSDEESIYIGDSSGYVYDAYTSLMDFDASFVWQYETPFLTLGDPGAAKQFHKVVAWVLDTGDWDLTLDYWSQYKFVDAEANTITQSITEFSSTAGLIWDVGLWDVNVWDSFTGKIVPVVFNLNMVNNNNQGDSIKLRFSETDAALGSEVIMYGYSIYYTSLPLRK